MIAPSRSGAIALGPWTDLEASPGAAALAHGAQAIRASKWIEARRALESALESMRGTASLDETMAGQALLGRACSAAEDPKCAEAAYGAVLEAWHGAETVRSLEAASGDEATRKQRLQRALLAVGEALYYAAEQKRRDVDRVAAPGYDGPADPASIESYLRDRVGPWVDAKQRLIAGAEGSYAAIGELEPAAPPRWVAAAAARTALMWGRFHAQFRAA
ncbi:MAG TPA: hypothetical protein VL400_12835, partial [Polyangiaceae bacterium]|nr:hypothetical protein [Polyangiaceae bacterium]